jgi:prepilin-type N-terminal cleavage/methylation domain-containing protein
MLESAHMNKGLGAKVTSVAKEPIDLKRRHALCPPCRFSQRGFSFLELVVVIAIIGLFAAIATLSIPGWRANIALKTTARDVISSFQFARVEAAKRNSEILVQVTAGGAGVGDCTVFIDNGLGGGIPDDSSPNGNEAIRILDLPARVAISSTTISPYVFNTRGIPTSGGGTITLTNGDRTYNVILSPAGAISLNGPY